jgi:hypothetical protein
VLPRHLAVALADQGVLMDEVRRAILNDAAHSGERRVTEPAHHPDGLGGSTQL